MPKNAANRLGTIIRIALPAVSTISHRTTVAAQALGVEMSEKDRHELGHRPTTARTAATRKKDGDRQEGRLEEAIETAGFRHRSVKRRRMVGEGEIRFEPATPRWYDAWRAHYLRYSGALSEPADDTIAATVWSWLLARTHGVEGILAIGADDELVGFAHFRPFPRTLDGNEACFLDDLWVTESHRGTGLAEALIDRVRATARDRGWTHVRWVAEAKNARARALYDRIAEDAHLVTYRIAVTGGE